MKLKKDELWIEIVKPWRNCEPGSKIIMHRLMADRLIRAMRAVVIEGKTDAKPVIDKEKAKREHAAIKAQKAADKKAAEAAEKEKKDKESETKDKEKSTDK